MQGQKEKGVFLNKPKRLFVLALDGTPYSLLQRFLNEGALPNFRALVAQGNLTPLLSVQPPLSSVAWASFMTGARPAEHGIPGFVERDPKTLEWFVPRADHLQRPTIFKRLSDVGKRIFVMNVPLTSPPQKINGIMISGFLNKDVLHATYPPMLGYFLKARGYVIDADIEIAKKDLNAFWQELNRVLEKRLELMFHFLRQEKWDFFMTHIMETDRLQHIFWKYFEEDQPPFAEKFRALYRRIDRAIGTLLNELDDEWAIMMLSDHGFTRLHMEFHLNRWLMENGYLYFEYVPPKSLQDLHPFTKAYSLYPGRIYINLKGREKKGRVNPGMEYEQVCDELSRKLLAIRDPQGRAVVREVRRGHEVYGIPPDMPHPEFVDPLLLKTVPDLIALPHKGYDIKGLLWNQKLFEQTVFNGTHTMDDAFFFYRGMEIARPPVSIDQIAPLVLKFFDEKSER